MNQGYFGHFFLGDFGNNEYLRKWLTICKNESSIDIKDNATETEIIKPYYSELKIFSPKVENKTFDVEVFIYCKNYF